MHLNFVENEKKHMYHLQILKKQTNNRTVHYTVTEWSTVCSEISFKFVYLEYFSRWQRILF